MNITTKVNNQGHIEFYSDEPRYRGIIEPTVVAMFLKYSQKLLHSHGYYPPHPTGKYIAKHYKTLIK